MVALLNRKNEDLIKKKGPCARVLKRLFIDFSDSQGQPIPQYVVESG